MSTILDLAAPLRSLLDAAVAVGRARSQADLGEKRVRLEGRGSARQGVVGQAIASGDRIKLSTLAAYARAAGWRLCLQARRADGLLLSCCMDNDIDATVAQARALLDALGLEMSLAVEANKMEVVDGR